MKVRTCVRPCMRTRGHWAPNMYETQRPHVAFALPPVPLWPTPWIPSAHFVPSKPISLRSLVNLYHTALPIFSLAQFFTYPSIVEWQVFFFSFFNKTENEKKLHPPSSLMNSSDPLTHQVVPNLLNYSFSNKRDARWVKVMGVGRYISWGVKPGHHMGWHYKSTLCNPHSILRTVNPHSKIHTIFREGSHWIFGKVQKGGAEGGSFSIQKFTLQILGTLNGAF